MSILLKNNKIIKLDSSTINLNYSEEIKPNQGIVIPNYCENNLFKIDDNLPVSYPSGNVVPSEYWNIKNNVYSINQVAYSSEIRLHSSISLEQGKSYTLRLETMMEENTSSASAQFQIILRIGTTMQFSSYPYVNQFWQYQKFSRRFTAKASGLVSLSLQSLGSSADLTPIWAHFKKIEIEEGNTTMQPKKIIIIPKGE